MRRPSFDTARHFVHDKRRGTGEQASKQPTRRRARRRVIGLGNTLLRDDGVGIYAARLLAERLAAVADVDVVETETAGFTLLELMEDASRSSSSML